MTTITGPVKNVAGELLDGTLKVQSARWRESSGSDAVIAPEPKTFAIVDGALTAPGIDPGRVNLLLQIGSSTTKPLTVDVPDVETITLHELISSVETVDPPVATKVHQDRLAVEALVASAEGIAGAQDEAVADLVTPGTETKAALDATYAPADGVATGDAVSDFVNSWWCKPRAIFSVLRQRAYIGGVNRVGTMQIATIDQRRRTADLTTLGTYEVDDHNVPAILVEDDKAPMVALVRHAVEAFVRVRIGAAPHDIKSLASATEVQVAFPGVCTYAHLIRRPGTNTVALLTRNEDGWYLRVSTDWGATWGTAIKFHGLAYATFRKVGTATIRYAITVHPITTPNSSIRTFDIDASTGAITAANGTSLGNLWSFSTAITLASTTYVRQSYDTDAVHNTNRTLDIGPGGSILAMQFHKDTPGLGGTYGVYRRATTGATPNSAQSPNDPQRGWTFEPIVASGVPVGYYQSSYVGGGEFGNSDDEVYLARESAGTWTAERWQKISGTWTKTNTIITRGDGEKLGRPQVPWGAEGTGNLALVEYFQYPSNTFMDYYGDQRVIRTGIVDITPPSTPGSLVATPGNGYVGLSWAASTDDVGVVGYEIKRGTTVLGTTAALSYFDIDAVNGTAYTYEVRAYDQQGNHSAPATSGSVTPAVPSGDGILTPGSLILLDPNHGTTPWSAGVPSGTVTNIARTQALAAAGSGVVGDFDFTVSNTLTGTTGVAERTTKGGLHVIVTQSAAAGGEKFDLQNAALRAYLAAHPSNDYFISLWAAVTRQSIETTPGTLARFAGYLSNASSDTITARLASAYKLTVAPSANRLLVKESASPMPIDTPINVQGAHSLVPTVHASDNTFVHFGYKDSTASALNKQASWVLYRVYLEDLTVSGRSPELVQSLDDELYATAFGTGGRYAGDTHTAVSTLA